MELSELIIKAHAHSHAAELAVQAGSPEAAYDELTNLSNLLDGELSLMERTPSESSNTPEH
ncbi:hypothetical protein ES703_93342 [subsurface metagenome]